MTEQITIYGLRDPNTGEIRYIGQTMHERRRLGQHIGDALNGSDRDVCLWIRTLLNKNTAPEMITLEQVDAEAADAAEREWIYFAQVQGWPIKNTQGKVNHRTSFADWVRQEIDKRGWQQKALARLAGISEAQVSRVLSGEREAGADFCLGLAFALSLPPVEVFRRAGLLPPRTDPNPTQTELLAITDGLNDDAIATLLDVANALLIQQHAANSQ